MTTRIALTFAGGASLGAYAGGAAYEMLWALSHRGSPGRPVVIDVLTGASAGAVTAALVARALLDAPTADCGAADNLYRAWVSDIELGDLLGGSPRTSLFSDRALWEAARRYLLPSDGDGSLHACTSRNSAHPAAAAELRMAFALSNLNGISYGLGYSGAPGRFDTTVFSDWISFRLGIDAPAGMQPAELWRSICRAAIASSAFPFAFPTVQLERRLADYEGSDAFDPRARRSFTYTDGGLFNNEPVGLARQIVQELEEDHPQTSADRRVHVLVDPHVAATAAVTEFTEEPLGLRLTLERLMAAITGEASRRDWVRAVRTNSRLEWKETFVRLLTEVVALAALGRDPTIGDRLEGLAQEIAMSRGGQSEGCPPPDEAEARRRLDRSMQRYGPMLCGDDPALATIRSDPALVRVFLCAAYIVESVAGLRDKVPLELFLVAPARGSLAGDFLGNFGGFLNREWREHDWRRGRADARGALCRMAGPHPEVEYAPDRPEAYVPARDLSGVGPADIPRDEARALAAAFGDRISALLAPDRSGRIRRGVARTAGRYLGRRIVDRLLRSGSRQV